MYLALFSVGWKPGRPSINPEDKDAYFSKYGDVKPEAEN